MRTRPREAHEPEPEWKQAGWSCEPRNGREWKALKSGEPQPPRREVVKKCRSCGGTDRTIVFHSSTGKLGTNCVPCRKRRDREYRLSRREANRGHAVRRVKRSRAEFRANGPAVDEHGRINVSASLLIAHPSVVWARIQQDETVLVTYLGEPMAYLVPAPVYERQKGTW